MVSGDFLSKRAKLSNSANAETGNSPGMLQNTVPRPHTEGGTYPRGEPSEVLYEWCHL